MAKNTNQGRRIGAVRDRSQVLNPRTGLWAKRDDGSGRFVANKTSGSPFKGVRREKG
jgi:hypothetical protein